MKKLKTTLICILILLSASCVAYAGTDIYVQPSESAVSPGEDIDIYLYVNSDSEQTAYYAFVDFDSTYFQFKSFDWQGDLSGFGDFNETELEGVVILNKAVAAQGQICKLTLTVKSTAGVNTSTTITMKFKAGSSGSLITASESIDIVCSHSYTDWIVTNYPGCTYEGSQYRECYYCHDIQYSSVPATGHYFSDWQVETEATCTEDGYGCCTCYYCGYSEGNSIPALGHIVTEGTVIKEATCTVPGVMEGTCERCGQKATVDTALAEHNYGEWTIIQESTCTENGRRNHICMDCGYKTEEVSLPLGHDYSGGKQITQATIYNSGLFEAYCKRCGNEGSVITPPSYTDEKTGVYFETTEGVFQENTVLEVTKTTTMSEASEDKDPEIKEIIFNIVAKLGSSEVQPSGSVTVVFPLPDGFSTNLAVYYEDSKGKRTELPLIIDTINKTITVELTHFSKYVIVNKDYVEAEPDEPSPAFTFPTWGHYLIEGVLLFTMIIVLLSRKGKKSSKQSEGGNQKTEEQDNVVPEESVNPEKEESGSVVQETFPEPVSEDPSSDNPEDYYEPDTIVHTSAPVSYDDMMDRADFVEVSIPKPKNMMDHSEMTRALDDIWRNDNDEKQ